MKLKTLLLALLLVVSGNITAQTLDDAYEAYNKGDDKAAFTLFMECAKRGDSEAQYCVGSLYEKGQGVSQSYAEAVKWYRKSAEQGFARAQFNLGLCYANGHGVTQSYSEAVKWYRKSAEQGYAQAQYFLGLCYEAGYGVTQSYSEAVKWYRKAAEQGHANAKLRLEKLKKNLE